MIDTVCNTNSKRAAVSRHARRARRARGLCARRRRRRCALRVDRRCTGRIAFRRRCRGARLRGAPIRRAPRSGRRGAGARSGAGLRIASVWELIATRVARLQRVFSELGPYLSELTSLLTRERERVAVRRNPEAELPLAFTYPFTVGFSGFTTRFAATIGWYSSTLSTSAGTIRLSWHPISPCIPGWSLEQPIERNG